MKVIFLDIDGVINSMDFLHAHHMLTKAKGEQFERFDQFGDPFDPRCMMHLERIVRETGAKIVISSVWRMSGLSTMQKMWRDRGLFGEIFDVTPNLNESMARGKEIKTWLDKRTDVESFVILDDDTDMLPEQKPNFIKVHSLFGLCFDDAEMAISILGRRVL